MTPEEEARQEIDRQLAACGWVVQDHKSMNIMAGLGVAVREFPLKTGFADYLLYADLRRLSRRFYQTLEPGLKALEALSRQIDGAEQIDSEAIAGYDVIRKVKSTETLRDRIKRLL